MKKLLAFLLVLSFLFAMTACGAGTATEPSGETGEAPTAAEPLEEGARVLRIGTIETAQSFSPIDEGSLPLFLAYEYLVRRTADGSLENWLAESIEWLDDKTLQIKLRDGITFADGAPMTAEDVIYSIQLMAKSTSMLADKYKCINFDESYAEDDLTVVLKLDYVYSVLDTWMARICLTEKAAASERASDDPQWWSSAITSSAYEIAENVDGSHCTFRLRDDYWNKDEMPQWDEISFYYFSNATAMFIAFENNELDMVLKADANDYARAVAGDVTNAESTVCYTFPVNNVLNLVLGAYTEEFEDIKVREAVAHAIDTDAIGTVAYGTLYKGNLDSVLSSSFTGAYAPQGVHEYDVEYAKQCMAESGYPDGFTLDVVAESSNGPMWEVIQAELAEIGITVNFQLFDFATMLSALLTPGATDMSFFGGGMGALDASEALSAYCEGNALTGSRVLDPDYNALFNQITTTTDEAMRNEVYAGVQQWLYENYRVLPIVEMEQTVVYDSSVVDCKLSDTTIDLVQYSCTPVA